MGRATGSQRTRTAPDASIGPGRCCWSVRRIVGIGVRLAGAPPCARQRSSSAPSAPTAAVARLEGSAPRRRRRSTWSGGPQWSRRPARHQSVVLDARWCVRRLRLTYWFIGVRLKPDFWHELIGTGCDFTSGAADEMRRRVLAKPWPWPRVPWACSTSTCAAGGSTDRTYGDPAGLRARCVETSRLRARVSSIEAYAC